MSPPPLVPGGDILARERAGGSQFGRLEIKPSTLSTLCLKFIARGDRHCGTLGIYVRYFVTSDLQFRENIQLCKTKPKPENKNIRKNPDKKEWKRMLSLLIRSL